MTRFLRCAVLVLVAAATGCGDDKKAIPPAGPMTPPGKDAEKEGGFDKGKKNQSLQEG
jgi:hypothetical protein